MPIDPTSIPERARAYLGSIVGNAWTDFTGQGRGSATQALWAGMKEAAQRTGLPLPTFAEVNSVRAWAAQQPAAMRNFIRAGAGETDWSRLTTTVSRSRDQEQRNAAPRFVAYWRMRDLTTGEPVDEWRVSSLGATRPSTVGDLRDQLTQIAAQGLMGSPPAEAEFTGEAFIAEM